MNHLPIFSDSFKTNKIAIKFPPELLMKLPEICEANHLLLFSWTKLEKRMKERVEEGLTIYIYCNKVEHEYCVNYFTEKYWRKDEYLLLELDDFATKPADCPDILDFL